MPALPNGLHRARLSRVGQTPAQIYTIGAGLTLSAAGVLTNDLITGLAGGQTVTGGTGAGENLTLQSTTDAVKGNVYLGSALTVFANGVAGNPRFNVDTTGLTTTTPVLVKNGKSQSGVEVQVTGTVPSGFLINNSAGVAKAAFGHAVSANDWITGTAAGDAVLAFDGAKKLQIGGLGGAAPTMTLDVTGAQILLSGTSPSYGFSGGAGTPAIGSFDARGCKFFANNAEVFQATSDGVNLKMASGKKLQADASSSASSCAFQFAGDPNTGLVANAADVLGLCAGGSQVTISTATITPGSQNIRLCTANIAVLSPCPLHMGNDVGTGLSAPGGAGTMSVVVSGTERQRWGAGTMGIFTKIAAPVGQQTSGADVTNNVTAGGTDNQIDDFAGALYATDAATIRNDIYQLARKVKQLNDGLRAFGYFT